MELTILAIAGVLVLAWVNKWNERRLAKKITDRLDEVMGRKD